MHSPKILVIQPDPIDPPNRLGDWLTEAGAELDVYRMPDHQLPADMEGYDGLLCLGGEMGVDDEVTHPWLADIRSLFGKARQHNVPTLGICLGAQLLAVATGGRVVRGDDGPESGPGLVAKKDAAWTDPLFADLPLLPDVLQFHIDVIDKLPPNAELLTSAPRYPHQAFRVGRVQYGLQFHIETTPSTVRDWVANTPDVAAAAPEDAFDEENLIQFHADVAETWRPFAHRFTELVAGRLEPVEEQPRTLPLA